MSDWNSESPHSWERVLGMVALPLFGTSRTRSLPGEYWVLLDGDRGSFAFASGDADRLLREPEPLAWSWSSNLIHTLIVDKRRDRLFVRRWDDPDNPKESNLPTDHQAPDVLEALVASGRPSGKTVIEGMVRMFRIIRANVIEDHGGTPNDVVEAFNALLIATDAARRGVVSPREWAKAATLRDVLQLIEAKGLALSDPSKVSSPVQGFRVQELIEALLERDPDTKYYLDPDLLIRHAAGALYQEAHIELIQPVVRQRSLFPTLDPLPAKGTLKSDAHYTPPPLARALVQEAVAALLCVRGSLPAKIELLDPASGSGVFLIEALREVAFGWGQGLVLRGLDSSPVACTMTEFCLRRAIQDDAGGNADVSVEVVKQDSLAPDFSWGSPDMILMNPPFTAWEAMPLHERRQVRQVLGDLYHYRADKALAFVSKAIQALKPGSVLATLVPAPLLEGRSGFKLRAAIQSDNTLRIHLIGQFRNFEYFQEATVEPAFLVISRSSKRASTVHPVRVAIAGSGSEDTVLRELRKQRAGGARDPAGRWEVFEADPADFTAPSWMPRSRHVVHVIETLARAGMPRVSDLFQVRLGIRTGENKVFLLAASQLDALDPSDRERRLFRPVAQNNTIRSGKILAGAYLFYPYDHLGNSLFRNERELEQGAPEFYRTYLVPNKDLLERRGSSQSRNWWELLRPRTEWQAAPQPKIVSAVFADSGSFGYDERGLYCVVQGLGWLWKESGFHGTSLPWAYLSLLNSRVFEFFLAQFCRRVRGGQFDVYPAFVNRVFLPDLSNKTRLPVRLLDELADMGRLIAKRKSLDAERLDSAVAAAYGLPFDEIRGAGLPRNPPSIPPSVPPNLERQFLQLAEQWRRETGLHSSVSTKIRHPAYQKIISMGEEALPLILRELRDRPDHWFEALKVITKQTPVPAAERADPRRAREAWLKWGRAKGLIE